MVKTAGPIPERALSPVLTVGDVVVDDYEIAGDNQLEVTFLHRA
jgi:hypothetical protein